MLYTLASYPFTLLIVCLFCCGVKQLFLPGMLLGRYIVPLNPTAWWYKPLFGCVGCFASTWGTLAFVLLFALLDLTSLPLTGWVFLWLLHVVPAVFVNRILWHLYEWSLTWPQPRF